MAESPEARVRKTVQLLNEQCAKLTEIQQQYQSGYDAAFDRDGAYETTKRWCERTTKIIQDRISDAEAAKFRRLLSLTSRLRGSWQFNEWLARFEAFIDELLRDVLDNPEDPDFDRLLSERRDEEKSSIAREEDEVATASYDVFLSYQTADKDEARTIHAAVQKAGRTCFMADRSLRPGDNFTDEIRNALTSTKQVWLLLSPDSLKSEWVQRECSAAWVLGKTIVPILFRCGPRDLPELLIQTHAIDYHNVDSLIARLGVSSAGKPRRTPKRHTTATFRTVVGRNSSVINAAGDINYRPRVTRKNVIEPGPEHVCAAQALEIKDRVLELAKMESASGRKMNPGAWYSKFYKQFDVTSYHLTPVDRFDDAIAWLNRQAVLLRPKLRRKNNKAWRNSLYTGIWARAAELGMDKDQVHALATTVTDAQQPVVSLADLGERHLKAVYDALFRQRRGRHERS